MSTEQDGLTPGQTGVDIAAGSSLLDNIVREREQRVAEEYAELDIPTWDGSLKAVYEVVERTELEKMIRRIQNRVQKAAKAGVNTDSGGGSVADADFLIKACVGIVAYGSDDAGDEIKEQVGDGLNMTFAQRLGKPHPDNPEHVIIPDPDNPEGEPRAIIRNPRDLVVYLVKGNGIALGVHAQKVARWMQDTSKPVEDPQ